MAAKGFDDKMDGFLATLSGWQGPLPRESRALRQLPQDMGGAGMPSLSGTRRAAYAASWGGC